MLKYIQTRAVSGAAQRVSWYQAVGVGTGATRDFRRIFPRVDSIRWHTSMQHASRVSAISLISIPLEGERRADALRIPHFSNRFEVQEADPQIPRHLWARAVHCFRGLPELPPPYPRRHSSAAAVGGWRQSRPVASPRGVVAGDAEQGPHR